MTPLEELQAAHERLTWLADESGGNWHRRTTRGIERRLIDDDFDACRADATTSSDADLIVALYRTIDTQLAILKDAIYGESDTDDSFGSRGSWFTDLTLPLARAINGGSNDAA